MIFVESEEYLKEFKALSRLDFESDDKILKIKRDNYIRQLVRGRLKLYFYYENFRFVL